MSSRGKFVRLLGKPKLRASAARHIILPLDFYLFCSRIALFCWHSCEPPRIPQSQQHPHLINKCHLSIWLAIGLVPPKVGRWGVADIAPYGPYLFTL